MYTSRSGTRVVRSTRDKCRIFKYMLVLAGFSFAVFVILKFLLTHKDDSLPWAPGSPGPEFIRAPVNPPKPSPCGIPKLCPEGGFSFYITSGAASVVAPKICLQNKMIVGLGEKNSKEGINIAVVNGKTGELIETGSFNMYDGEIDPLITFLQSIKEGSIVLMASFDDPATKLNSESRKLISELGSSTINSLSFRDNWIFVGGKGSNVMSKFEKVVKNNREINKYEGWPEMIEMEGCIPHYSI